MSMKLVLPLNEPEILQQGHDRMRTLLQWDNNNWTEIFANEKILWINFHDFAKSLNMRNLILTKFSRYTVYIMVYLLRMPARVVSTYLT